MADQRPLSFGIRFPPTESPEATGALALKAEEAGFDTIWALDTPLMAGPLFDPYVDLVSCALSTTKIRMGAGVSPLFLRSPVATAAAVLSLDRISGGRAFLGMGSGGSALVTLGSDISRNHNYVSGAAARQDQLREEITFMRRLFAGEPVALGTRPLQLDGPRPIQVWLAASGPRMCRLAGELADGVVLHVGAWPESIRDAIADVRAGAEAAGRDPDEIELACYTPTHISDDRAADIRHVKPAVAFFYGSMPRLVEKAGFAVERRAPERMPHPDMTHAFDWEEAMAAADSYIADGFAEKFCLVGPVDSAVEKIKELADVGITQIYVRDHTSYHLPHELVETFAKQVIPRVRGAGY